MAALTFATAGRRSSSANPVHTASALILAAAATSSWTGVRAFGINLSDWLLAAALAMTAVECCFDRRRVVVRAWMVMPIVALPMSWRK